MRFVFSLFAFICTFSLFAQSTEYLDVPLTLNGIQLKNAWAGGLDAPQFSTVDFNNDGADDLYVFDRIGHVHRAFLNVNDEYVFAPEYTQNFPALKHFVLLRDYDGDGIMDIFAHAKYDEPIDGLIVFKGKYTDGVLDFDRVNFWRLSTYNIIPAPLSSGAPSNLYVPSTDVPDINDIDGDGDLDIISFDVSGSYAVFYENISVEQGYGTDSLIFEKADNCWGKFYEASMSEQLSLSEDPNICATGFTGDDASERHAGSALVTVDLDNDGAREMLLGDIINPHIYMLENGGDVNQAHITGQDNDFPSYDEGVFISDFVAPYILDLNFDGIQDFVAAPNANNAPNYEAAWFYANTGTNAFPNFELQQKDFLTSTMIDFGSGAIPAFADVNGDDLLDIVVGTTGYNLNAGLRDPRLFLFLNTGTASSPEYTLTDDDWLDFSIYGSQQAAEPTFSYAPNFGDIDADGDLDLLVGEYYGTLFFAENEAGQGNPMQFSNVIVEWQNLDVGLNSVPQIVDLDRDGRADIVIGERNGNLNFMKNIGTPNEPDFFEEENDAPNINFLGQVDAAAAGEGFGHATPFFYDKNGEWILYLGTRSQDIKRYNNIDPNNLSAAFNLLNAPLGDIHEGERTHAVLADLNGDTNLEMLIGNFRGGLAFFGTNISTDIQEVETAKGWSVFPNPVSSVLRVAIDETVKGGEYRVVNTVGQIVQKGVLSYSDNFLNVSDLAAGVYFVEINGQTAKFIKK